MQSNIRYQDYEIDITAESPAIPCYNAESADNVGLQEEYFFGDDGYCPSSRLRVVVRHGDEIIASRVLLANGGATGVHDHTAFVHENNCIIAIGPFVCAVELPTLGLLWHVRADTATCFGIHDAPGYASFISHGEIAIARLTYSGELLWSVGGRDIFTEGFALREGHAEAVDFEGTRYKFDLETGQLQFIST